jgi:hypothetical protein
MEMNATITLGSGCCPTCRAQLVELERWTFTVADLAAAKRRALGADGELSATERRRFEQLIGDGSVWHEVTCPRDPRHVGRLFERVEE